MLSLRSPVPGASSAQQTWSALQTNARGKDASGGKLLAQLTDQLWQPQELKVALLPSHSRSQPNSPTCLGLTWQLKQLLLLGRHWCVTQQSPCVPSRPTPPLHVLQLWTNE